MTTVGPSWSGRRKSRDCRPLFCVVSVSLHERKKCFCAFLSVVAAERTCAIGRLGRSRDSASKTQNRPPMGFEISLPWF